MSIGVFGNLPMGRWQVIHWSDGHRWLCLRTESGLLPFRNLSRTR